MILFQNQRNVDYKNPKTSYKYSIADYEEIQKDDSWTGWLDNFDSIASTENTEAMWNSLRNKLIDIRNKYIKKNTAANSPWKLKHNYPLSKEARIAINDKAKLHRKWIYSGQSEHRSKYSKARNKVKTLVRRDKRNYERKIAKIAKLKPKIFWSHTRKRLKTKIVVAPLLEDVNDKDSLIFEDNKKANILQKQFSGVYTKEPVEELPFFRTAPNQR